MALETATYIDGLVSANPVATDQLSQVDDHIRLVKSTILASFPGVTGAVTATHTELNTLDGVTASTAELNLLTGLTAVAEPLYGTWTPTIQDLTLSDAEGQTYSLQEGNYVKLGKLCFVTGVITISSLGTLTGGDTAALAGLPFTSFGTGTHMGSLNVARAASLNITAGQSLSVRILENATYGHIYIWDDAGGTTTLTITELSAGASLYFSGCYYTSS